MNYIDPIAIHGEAALSTVTTRCVGRNYDGLCRWQSKQELQSYFTGTAEKATMKDNTEMARLGGSSR